MATSEAAQMPWVRWRTDGRGGRLIKVWMPGTREPLGWESSSSAWAQVFLRGLLPVQRLGRG